MVETTPPPPARGWKAGAFEQVVRAHQQVLLRRAMRLTGDRADAWDLVQDTFVRALQHAPQEAPADGLRRWLYTVMGNLHVDRCRFRLRAKVLALSDELTPAVSTDDGDEPAWRSVDHAQVEHCVTQLEPPFREAFVLYEFEGLSLSDIARKLQVAVGTAGTRVHRARRRLRVLLLGSVDPQIAT